MTISTPRSTRPIRSCATGCKPTRATMCAHRKRPSSKSIWGSTSSRPRDLLQRLLRHLRQERVRRNWASPTCCRGEWTGPIHSTYGAHLVLIEQRTAAQAGFFDDIRDRLRMDFIRVRRLESEELRYARMLQRYQVTIEWPDEEGTESR